MARHEMVLHNKRSLFKLKYGMTMDEVHSLMHKRIIGNYTNPHRTSMFMNNQNVQIEVLYYWAIPSGKGSIEKNLVPIIFADKKVIGWGNAFWTEYVKKIQIRFR